MIGQSKGPWEAQQAGLYINVDTADETYQKALDAGAATVMEPIERELRPYLWSA